MMKNSVEPKDISLLVMAGGSGQRMGASVRKQYLELSGKPILVWTLERLLCQWGKAPEVVLVVPEEDFGFAQGLLSCYNFEGKVRLAAGGATRYESVWNGLREVTRRFVAVHDGVRPFVSKALLERLFSALAEHDAVVPGVSATDSVRLLDEVGENRYFPRERVMLVQTPQCFRRELLVEGYEAFFADPRPECTDDASIVSEMLGVAPFIVEGDAQNIKITRPQDLVLAEYILGAR